jgi:hypothetical protein
MKRFVLGTLVVVATVAGVVGLASATQNRPDAVVPGSETIVEFRVSTRDYQRGEDSAAVALWAVCSATVDGTVSPVPVRVGDDWQVTISPAIGEHGENRLVGCLEDLTLDRVVGEVVDLRRIG